MGFLMASMSHPRMRARPRPGTRSTDAAAAPASGATHPVVKAARVLVVPLLLAAFLVQAVAGVRTKSATWDETNYFGMGDYLLRNHRWDVPSSILHPPLAFYLDSVPVLFADLDRRVWTSAPTGDRNLEFLGAADRERGQALLSSAANRDDRLLLLSRLMAILQAMLLGYFVYLFAAALYGWNGGVLALVFFAFCPNMLAHGSLITPDITLTACFFIAIYFLRGALVSGKPASFVWAGVTLGLALLSKFTALLLLPIEAAILAFVLVRRGRVPLRWLAVSIACALVVFMGGYLFNLTPYFQGLSVQRGHGGHDAFLMGQISADGWWYYCLVAFALKTPIPTLLFLAVGLCRLGVRAFSPLWAKPPTQARVNRAGRPRAADDPNEPSWYRLDRVVRAIVLDDVVLWLPVLVLFVFFSIELRSIGLRYLLPVYPFIFVLAAGAVLSLKRLKYLLLVPMVWYVVGTVAIWPDHLAYFNESIGGAGNGYHYLVDSNLDWGQDLKGLKAFMDRRGIDRIYLSYFGLDSPDRYGIHYDWLPSFELRNPNPQPTINLSRGRYLAISVTNLQGVYMKPQSMFRWLDRYTPIAQIGHSIFVYHLE